jgi:hypothetical protein
MGWPCMLECIVYLQAIVYILLPVSFYVASINPYYIISLESPDDPTLLPNVAFASGLVDYPGPNVNYKVPPYYYNTWYVLSNEGNPERNERFGICAQLSGAPPTSAALSPPSPSPTARPSPSWLLSSNSSTAPCEDCVDLPCYFYNDKLTFKEIDRENLVYRHQVTSFTQIRILIRTVYNMLIAGTVLGAVTCGIYAGLVVWYFLKQEQNCGDRMMLEPRESTDAVDPIDDPSSGLNEVHFVVLLWICLFLLAQLSMAIACLVLLSTSDLPNSKNWQGIFPGVFNPTNIHISDGGVIVLMSTVVVMASYVTVISIWQACRLLKRYYGHGSPSLSSAEWKRTVRLPWLEAH